MSEPKTIRFELTTPERPLVDKAVLEAILPTSQGEITVLPGHVPLVAVLAPGMVTLRLPEGQEEYLAVDGGFVEVLPDSRLVVLADGAARADELDMDKVEAARAAAQTALEEARDLDTAATASLMAGLERELARVKTARRYRGRRGPNPTSS